MIEPTVGKQLLTQTSVPKAKTTLLALHGYTLNAAVMRRSCEAVFGSIRDRINIIYLDAPYACSPEAVEAAYAAWQTKPLPGPHLTWWHASSDGQVYEGWETTLEMLRKAMPERGPVGIFGFSQGAMVTATLAALSAQGLFPELAFAVLVAGRVPRAGNLKALFDRPIAINSLHVWGERDQIARQNAPELFEAFESGRRRQLVWRGSHVIPPGGDAARGITEFVLKHSEHEKAHQ